MIRANKPWQEVVYAPQEAKTFQHVLTEFMLREFPRLGGPWVVGHFVAKLMALLDEHYLLLDRIQPGQTVWMAVAVDETPGYGKLMSNTRQVPVVLTLVNQADITALKEGIGQRQVLRQAIARVAREAYVQGGVLTQVDLGLLFARSRSVISCLISQYEKETQQVVPRRGTVHDMGRAPTHKRIICYKAFVEGKPTHTIARETCHTPFAVDHYLLDFARVYFAVHQRGFSPEEAAFTLGRSLSLVETYLALVEEFGLSARQIVDRVSTALPADNEQETPSK
jgi:hypothetical protein